MKIINSVFIDPMTFEPVGPHCCVFNWDISRINEIEEWVESHHQDLSSWQRVQVDMDRMIRKPRVRVYFDSMDLALMFKLAFGGQ